MQNLEFQNRIIKKLTGRNAGNKEAYNFAYESYSLMRAELLEKYFFIGTLNIFCKTTDKTLASELTISSYPVVGSTANLLFKFFKRGEASEPNSDLAQGYTQQFPLIYFRDLVIATTNAEFAVTFVGDRFTLD